MKIQRKQVLSAIGTGRVRRSVNKVTVPSWVPSSGAREEGVAAVVGGDEFAEVGEQ